MKRRPAIVAAAAFVVAAAMAWPATAGEDVAEATLRIAMAGGERRAVIVAPEAPAPGPAPPAVLALHGGGGSPSRARRYMRLGLAARGWVEIYPRAKDRNWNDGRTGADGRPLRATDDVGFLRALIARLGAEGRIDPARVYVVGASNGGMMALRLACDAPGLVAGVAVVIAAWPVGLDCPPGPPVPALFLHGDADPLVPHAGGPIGRGRRGGVLSGAETLAIWAARNRCGPYREAAIPDRDPGDGARTVRRDYWGCAAPLIHYLVMGGGHTWPGGRDVRLLRPLLGPTTQDFDLTPAIERFFAGLAGAAQ